MADGRMRGSEGFFRRSVKEESEEFIVVTSSALSYSGITDLGEGKAYALQNVLPLDGRISAYPGSARGFAPSNCYLLYEDDGAILLDTGYNGHRRSLFN